MLSYQFEWRPSKGEAVFATLNHRGLSRAAQEQCEELVDLMQRVIGYEREEITVYDKYAIQTIFASDQEEDAADPLVIVKLWE